MMLLLLAVLSFCCRRCTTVVNGRVRRRSLGVGGDVWAMTMMLVDDDDDFVAGVLLEFGAWPRRLCVAGELLEALSQPPRG